MHTFLIAAISKDGFIAEKVDQVSTDWTSPEDAKFFRQRTKDAGVMVMGRATFETIGRSLPGRVNVVMSRRVELSTQSTEDRVCILEDEAEPLDKKTLYLTRLHPEQLVKKLENTGYSELAVCGGASVYRQFLESGLLDTLYLTIEPVTFGIGVPLFGEGIDLGAVSKIPDKLELGTWEFVLKEQIKLNESGTTLVEYSRQL